MKKTIKKTLAFVLSVLMLVSVMPVSLVFAESADVYEYTTTDNEATITKYNGSETEVIIPEKLGVNTVVAIGTQAFYGNTGIVSVAVPDTVNSIGEGAFMGCSELKSVVLGDSVSTIGNVVFRNCYNLKEITINKSVTSIGDKIFFGCSDLTINYCGSKEDWDSLINKNTESLGGVDSYVINYNYGYDCEKEGAHILTEVAAKSETCDSDGNIAYWNCEVCKKNFVYEGTELIEVEDVAVASGHKLTKTDAKAPTCEDDGSCDYWACSVCEKIFADENGETELKDIIVPASHKIEAVAEVKPTCTEDGVKAHYRCTVCSKIFEDEKGSAELKKEDVIVSAGGHNSYSEIFKDSTCTEKGNKTYIGCYICGKYFTDKDCKVELDFETDIEIAAKDHAWSSNFVDGKDGKHYKYCTREGCGIINTESARDHIWDNGTVTTAPECTEKGVRTFKCTVANCTATRTEAVPAAGHTESAPVKEHIVEMECDKDGSYDSVVYCATCKTELSRKAETVAHGHEIKITFPIEYKSEATCTEPAILETWCYRCEQNVEIPVGTALGHTEVSAPDKAPTCENEGYKGGMWCSVCEEYIVAPETIPALEHNWEKTATTATCTVAGEATFVCKNDGTHIKTEAEEALGHSYNDWVETAAATCDKAGHETRVCTRCLSPETREIPATNHPNKYYQKVDVVPGTCTTPETWTNIIRCIDCDEIINRESETGEKNPENHTGETYTESENGIDGTCISPKKWDEVTYCSGCEAVIERVPMTGEKDAYNHTNLVKTDAVEATCEEDGNIAYWTCEGCAKLYSDEDAENEIAAEDTAIEAEDHRWGDWEYLEDGKHRRVCENNETHIDSGSCLDSEEWKDCYCDLCGNLMGHSFTIADCTGPSFCRVCGVTTGDANPENHVGGTNIEIEDIVEGTCITDKTWNVVTYCLGCDEIISTVPKTGEKDPDNHDWSDIIAPNNGADKVHYVECQRQGCDAKVYIDHNEDTKRVSKEATCTENGQQYYYCSYCKSYIYEAIPATGHTDANKDNKCDTCGVLIEEPKPEDTKPEDTKPEDTQPENPSVNCDCNCHKNGIMGFLFDFILFFQRLFGTNRTCACGVAHY